MAIKSRKFPLRKLIFFILALAFLGYWLSQQNADQPSNKTSDNTAQQIINPNTPLTFTKHAKCRMACRGITEEEIREVLREGSINEKKSDKDDEPCPSYAIEDRVADGQLVRIVFGICGDQIKVITCIDLENDHPCSCP